MIRDTVSVIYAQPSVKYIRETCDTSLVYYMAWKPLQRNSLRFSLAIKKKRKRKKTKTEKQALVFLIIQQNCTAIK